MPSKNGFQTKQKMAPSARRAVDHSWDFANAETKYLTHGIHSYPAMMIPQVAHRIIQETGKDAALGLDPFCGSGSVLLEFKLAGIDAFGVDINPLAALVSKVKNTPLSPQLLKHEWQALRNRVGEITFSKEYQAPEFFNVSFWFKPDAIASLSAIRAAIEEIEDAPIKNFFLVCFSDVVRKASNTRGGEFKLFRISDDKLKNYAPDGFKTFSQVVERNLAGMTQLYAFSKDQKTGSVNVVLDDVISTKKIPAHKADVLVTSPPYGDSKTTVAYGQFSRLSLQWLGFPEEIKHLDKNMLGGRPAPDLDFDFASDALSIALEKIASTDELRARDVLSFFIDFRKAASNIDSLMKGESTICLVVGNRTVKGIKIQTDEIMADIFSEFDYRHEKTIIRQIPSKRMPKRNSPTNVVGATGSTMNEEYIVMLSR